MHTSIFAPFCIVRVINDFMVKVRFIGTIVSTLGLGLGSL